MFETSVYSPIGIVRLPARRERELLALRLLGFLAHEDGHLAPGTDLEMKEARTWLLPS